jgi:YgiT-type zinc finger domain-containing protein
MRTAEVEARWRELAEEVFAGLAEWRAQHPKATLSEIEAALDERLSRVRARLLEDVALASAARDVAALEPGERPRCPACGHELEARGRRERTLTTHHDRTIRLERGYAACPDCGAGLFPPG